MSRLPYSRILSLHTLGLCDAMIARNVGVGQPTVSRYLRRHSRPPNKEPPAKAFERTRAQADRKRQEEEKEAARLGWPGCRLLEARIMNALSRYPHETQELMAATAHKRAAVAEALGALMDAGLVMKIKGRRRPLYRALRLAHSPEVMHILKKSNRFAETESNPTVKGGA